MLDTTRIYMIVSTELHMCKVLYTIYTDVSDHFLIVHIDFEMKLCDTDTAVTHRNLSYKNRTIL